MKLTKHFTVDSHDVDFNGVARASSLIRFMQEAASAHLNACGTSNEALRASGRAFLLSRFSVSFYESVSVYEELEVQTWATESRGFSFGRCYRILRNGTIVAEATSVWALVDIATRRPTRVSDFETDLEPEDMLALDVPPRVICPQGDLMHLRGEHTVTYRELDANVHMNNTYYSDMLCDTLNMQGKRICRMSINFLNEAKHRDALNIYCAEQRDDIFFKTVRPDGKVNIEAQLMLCEI